MKDKIKHSNRMGKEETPRSDQQERPVRRWPSPEARLGGGEKRPAEDRAKGGEW